MASARLQRSASSYRLLVVEHRMSPKARRMLGSRSFSQISSDCLGAAPLPRVARTEDSTKPIEKEPVGSSGPAPSLIAMARSAQRLTSA
jgi:hypothetical protein